MKFRLSSEYNELSLVRGNEPHHGIDFAMPEGTTLRSVADGVVESVVDYGSKNLGKGVMIRNEDGTVSIYGHLSEVDVSKGDVLNAGDAIGLSGNTGNSTGPHLHFGMKDSAGEWVDPTPIADRVVSLQGGGNWFAEKYNELADWVIGKEVEFVVNPFIDLLKDGIHALTDVMPEIGAALTIMCAISMMLSGEIAKWTARWGLGMTGVIVWLVNANS